MQEHLTACEDPKFSYKDSQHHQGQPASLRQPPSGDHWSLKIMGPASEKPGPKIHWRDPVQPPDQPPSDPYLQLPEKD